ncbi:MAG: heparinase II/III-family protein, partial [Gammaproteobacteria bacterium]|nr:heparinase II/III-family protein [Gammaproteobacteria bacterium]
LAPDTARTERAAYLRRLRTEPAFLLRHVPALSAAVLRRIRTRLTVKLSGHHQGSKLTPPWLAGGAVTQRAAHGAAPVGALLLPVYALSAPTGAAGAAPPCASTPSADPEDYLAAHRWGALTDSLLAGTADWQEQLAACVQWLEAHRDTNDPAWEPYSCCERVANLLVFLAAMQRSPDAPAVPAQLREFLQDSLGWVVRHLEYYGPTQTNNHIINNARAIVMAAAALQDAAACATGVEILRRCLPGLITPQGFLRERSSHYQLVVLNWLLDARRFLEVAGEAATEARTFLSGCIERMVPAAAMLCARGARLLSVIGDVSPDLTPAQALARLRALYPEFWPPAERAQSAALRDGWFRLDCGQSTILGNFPTGPFPAAFPTHGHADSTSFTWLHQDTEILVDRGRYRYTADGISAFQKSASGHNVPLVNGFAPLCESLVSAGHWWPLPYAAAWLEASVEASEIVLNHDGFRRATCVEHHCRRLRLERDSLTVRDSFAGEGRIELAFCWHFGAGVDSFDVQRLVAHGPTSVALSVTGLAGAPRAVIIGAAQGGWVSRNYAERQPALAIFLYWKVELPATVSTRFCLTSA